MGRKTRGVYGKPLAGLAGVKIPLTTAQLQVAANIILESIHAEIKRDMALSSGLRPKGDPVPLPRSQRFIQSFKVRLKGASTLEIYSDWPTASAHTTKLKPGFVENQRPDTSAPFEMTWLMQPTVPLARIVTPGGQVIIRTTPLSTNQGGPWIHPGFKKYTFLERGLRKGRIKAAEALAGEILLKALKGVDVL